MRPFRLPGGRGARALLLRAHVRSPHLRHSAPFAALVPARAVHSSKRPPQEVLFGYTSHRFLCNEEQQLKLKYTPFNVDALEEIACKAVEAKRCLEWEKIGEGSFNKVFRLVFDNDATAVIRIPCPITGPNTERIVASEVATMCYIHERFAHIVFMPKPPRVLAYSPWADNPVGTPFIICEYLPGVPLSSRWAEIQGKNPAIALACVLELEKHLLYDVFAQHGSLYFAEDVADDPHQSRIYAGVDSSHLGGLEKALDERYRIGPALYWQLWRGQYGKVDADRGPWPDMQTMITSIAEHQLRAIDTAIQLPYNNSKPSDAPLLRRLLELCKRIAPHVVPADPALTAPVMNHPDLGLQNLLVSADGITSVRKSIDWQFASILPFATQCDIPRAFRYYGGLIPIPADGSMPPWPENMDAMSPEERQVVERHHRYACRERAYIMEVAHDPLRGDAFCLPQWNQLKSLLPTLSHCIADGPHDLRGLLIALQKGWAEFSDAPCPLDFSEEERAAHDEEDERVKAYVRNSLRVYDALECDEVGAVLPQRYDAAKQNMERLRESWDEEEMKGPFPLYEGCYAYHLS